MLKKFFSLFLLATAMVACTEDYTDWAEPQKNDQPATVSFGNGSVSEVALIDFANVTGDDVQVCNITAPTSSDSEYAPIYKITLGNNEYDITADGKMKAEDLKNFVLDNYGKAPYERTIAATVSMWLNNGTTTVKTATSNAFNVKAKLVAPEIFDHLYLIGAPSEWSPTCTTLPFTHSDQNVYDDPIFTITFPISDGDTWFALADDKTVSTNDWSNVFGCKEGNGKNLIGEQGLLTRRSELSDDGSFMVHVDGDAKFIKMTVDMLNGTYLIEKVNFESTLSYVGTAGGWNNNGGSSRLVLTDMEKGKYAGYIYGKQESYGNTFRLFAPSQLGSWDASTGNSDCSEFIGSITAGGSDNNFEFTAGDGVYYVEYSAIDKTISATKIEYMGVTGNFTGWNEGVQMTWNADEYCFEAAASVDAGGWKFRANGLTDPDWKINLGGNAVGDLYQNGPNLDVVGSKVKLYPCRTTSDKIYCTVE